MVESLYLPVTDEKEIENLLHGFPLVVDVERFVGFVAGFPRRYLVQTPKVEIVKHYLLAESLGSHKVITSLSPEQSRWKLSLITRDRSFLFSRIAGTLSCFKMNILAAEAFMNSHAVVLDTLYFEDADSRFSDSPERQRFQKLLEDVVSGVEKLEPLLQRQWPGIEDWREEVLQVWFDQEANPRHTLMGIHCRDRFGLLYLISHRLSELGYSIEMAFIRTEGHEADDEFYLTREGRKLADHEMEELRREFSTFRVPRFSGS